MYDEGDLASWRTEFQKSFSRRCNMACVKFAVMLSSCACASSCALDMSSFSRCKTAFVTSDVSGSDEIVAVSAASYGFVGHSGGRGKRARSCEVTDASVAESFMLG